MKNTYTTFNYQIKSKGGRMPNQKPKRIRRKVKVVTHNSKYIVLMKLALTLLNMCAVYLIYSGIRDCNILHFIYGMLISIFNGLVMSQLNKK